MTSAAEKRHSGRLRRQRRVRKKIHGTADRPRLAVFRSNKHLSAQLIDDDAGRTIAAASSLEADLRKAGSGSTVEAAARVGKAVAQRAKQIGIKKVVYDRGGFLYHGRIVVRPASSSINCADRCLLLRNTAKRGRSAVP